MVEVVGQVEVMGIAGFSILLIALCQVAQTVAIMALLGRR